MRPPGRARDADSEPASPLRCGCRADAGRRPGALPPLPRAPPARGASWVLGGAGAAPLRGARGRRDRVAAGGRRPALRRSAPPCPAPAAGMAALLPPGPPPDEQDFIQAYEEVREKYKGTAPPPPCGLPAVWPALTGPPAGQSGL